jgi:hypothetical protein
MTIGRKFSKDGRTFYKVDIEKYQLNGDYIFVYQVDQRERTKPLRKTTSTKYTPEYLAEMKAELINSDNILEGTIVHGGNDNIFNNLDIETVRKFFHRLVDKKGKGKESFLTENQLNLFINRAFLGDMSILPIEMTTHHGDAVWIRSLFYIFYKMCTLNKLEPQKKNLPKKYQNLLKDNFTDFGSENDASNNFYFKDEGNIWDLNPYSKISDI